MATALVAHDIPAEEALIGAMLVSPAAAAAAVELLVGEDFYSPRNACAFVAACSLHSRGERILTVTLVDEMHRQGAGEMADGAEFVRMMGDCPSPAAVGQYAAIVVRHATMRRVQRIAREILERDDFTVDPYALADTAAGELTALDAPMTSAPQLARTLDETIADAEATSPWVIPGLLRSDWRAVVTGVEGHGKSTLLRQLCALSAQGIHPLRFEPMEPIRALVVDLENPAAAIAETGATMVSRLRLTVRDAYDADRVRVLRRPDGLDLRSRRDRTQIEHEIVLQRPQLVAIGPAYKMLYRRDQGRHNESHEESTDPVLRILDDLRTRHGFALVVEHHAPQGYGGQRDLRPYGSQRWMAWPELGISMRPDRQHPGSYDLTRFRGDRLTADWPVSIERDRVWPWAGRWASRDEF